MLMHTYIMTQSEGAVRAGAKGLHEPVSSDNVAKNSEIAFVW
jgi:hypothetical protein